MKIQLNTKVNLTVDEIVQQLQTLTPDQKIKIASVLSKYFGTYDMTYVEGALKSLSKIYLKRINNNKELYNRNRKVFKAIKTISKIKDVE